MDELPLVSPLERAVFLRAQPYFDGLDSAVLAVLASHTREHRARAGEVLYDEAKSLRRVSFIVDGTVRTLLDDETLFVIDAPGGVGLAHGLARSARPPIAVADTECLTLQIELDGMIQILEDHFSLVLQICRIFARLVLDSERVVEAPAPDWGLPTRGDDDWNPLDLVHRLAWARRAPIFRNANLSVLAELMGTSREMRLASDEWLWRAGDPAESVAVLVDGSLHLESPARSQHAGPGSLVGFAELFADRPRVFGARAEEPCTLLVTPRSAILDAMEDHFDLALDLLDALATRHLALRAPRALDGDTSLELADI